VGFNIVNVGFAVPGQITYVFDVVDEQKIIESINYDFKKYRYRNKKTKYLLKRIFSPSVASRNVSINHEMSSGGKKYDVKPMNSFCNAILLKIVIERGRELYNEIYSTVDAVTGYKTDRKNISELGNELFSALISLEYVAARKMFPTQSELIVTSSLSELLKVQPSLYEQVRANYLNSVKKSIQTVKSITDEIITTFPMNIQSKERELEIRKIS
jgi:hypothetical protein